MVGAVSSGGLERTGPHERLLKQLFGKLPFQTRGQSWSTTLRLGTALPASLGTDSVSQDQPSALKTSVDGWFLGTKEEQWLTAVSLRCGAKRPKCKGACTKVLVSRKSTEAN